MLKAFLNAVKNEPSSGWHQKDFSAQTSSAKEYWRRRLMMNILEKKKPNQQSNKVRVTKRM